MTRLDLGQESIPPDEADAIQAVARISERILDKQPVVKRGEHPKGHGCVRGIFTVDRTQEEDSRLRFGVFREPGASFPICIRFSNFSVKDDAKGDVHGMAIKLFGVPGEKLIEDEKDAQTQDFLLVDSPVFVVRNAKDYVDTFEEIERSNSRNPLGFFFPSWNPLTWRWRELWIGLSYRLNTISSPLETPYWSMVPYRLGPAAVKLMAKPLPMNHKGRFWSRLGFRTRDYLRDTLREHLSDRPAAFDLFVQFQTDPKRTPIEDPRIRWRSPFYKVATLTIPAQTFESPAQEAFCENLSFTPWHALPEHRPLGGINRTRKVVYELISRLRNRLNQVPHREPTVEELDAVFPPDLSNWNE